MPAGTTFYFACAALLGVAQNTLTMQPWFRRWVGVSPLPPPPVDPTPTVKSDVGAFAAMKERFGKVVQEAQSKQGGMAQRMQAKSEADRKEKAKLRREEEEWQAIQRRINRKR